MNRRNFLQTSAAGALVGYMTNSLYATGPFDGTVIGAGDASSPTLTVNDPDRLARRMGRHGLVGFGESYMAGEWKSTDLVAVLTILAPALNHLVSLGLRWLKPLGIAAEPSNVKS